MKIVHIAAEVAPIAKVGGLGDVTLGLCRALSQNHEVELIVPKYDVMHLHEIEELRIVEHNFTSEFANQIHLNSLWQGRLKGVPLTLIESHDPYEFFERGTIYGCSDDVERFLYFCHTALTYLLQKKSPDIIHLHDWHAATIAPLLASSSLKNSPKTVLTLHNLAYQGKCFSESVKKIPLSTPIAETLKEGNSTTYNLLQGGILHADALTTVSPTYANEIKSHLSFGLDKVLLKRKEQFFGILNGIDYESWNPLIDPFIPYHYDNKQLKNEFPYIRAKQQLKEHLAEIFLMEKDKAHVRPLVAAISRLVPQKGPELIEAALEKTLLAGGQFVLLGSAMESKTHDHFYMLKRRLAKNRNVHIELSYNEKLSHLVYAAADLFVVPSHFEPCGLTQLIAMRYGTVPIVRRTGGLADTVFDEVNGFTFDEATVAATKEAVDVALNCYRTGGQGWYNLMHNAMRYDSSWSKPAAHYVELYNKLINSEIKIK